MAPQCLEDGVATGAAGGGYSRPWNMTDKVHSSTETGSQLLYFAIQYTENIQSRTGLRMWNTKAKWHWLENHLDVKTVHTAMVLSQSVTAKLDRLY